MCRDRLWNLEAMPFECEFAAKKYADEPTLISDTLAVKLPLGPLRPHRLKAIKAQLGAYALLLPEADRKKLEIVIVSGLE